jgi:DMSO/TMAO reductase YedYZ molybdopterin-dependent catalytic subunit
MQDHDVQSSVLTRRRVLGGMGIAGLALMSSPASAQETVDLHVPGGPSTRVITTSYPQKGRMILQRTSPPWLETPFEVFDKGVFTPNDQHYVSWHWANFPGDIDVDSFRLTVRGQVNQALSLSLKDILQGLPRIDIAAVNQCAGNSRIYAVPRVAGAQWADGSMSNAIWTGVRLKDVLDRAGVKAGAIQVRFGGLDEPVMEGAPKFLKSLTIDHARDGEVMIAFAMNGEQLPLLNGFSAAARCARLVRSLLGQDAERRRSSGSPRHQLLDDDGLPRARYAALYGQARRDRVQAGAGNPQCSALVHYQHPRRRQRAGGDASFGAGHCLRRRLRCCPRRSVHRRRQELAADPTRCRPGNIRLSAMAVAIHLARARRAHPDGSLHQHQERGAARFPDLESGRLHVQYR